MFGKLKEKLKQAVSVFSKKTEEEAVVEKVAEEKNIEEQKQKIVEKEVQEKKEIKEKPVKKEKQKKGKEKTTTPKQKKEVSEAKEKDLKTAEEVKPKKTELVEETIPAEKAEELPEKKTFFKKLFGRKEEEKKEEKETAVETKKTEEIETETLDEEEADQEKVETEKIGIKEGRSEELPEERVEEELTEEKQFEEKESFFSKVKTSLTTKKISAEKFEELFWELELALLENNVSVEVIEKIKEDLKAELVDKPLPRDVPKKIEETLKRTLTEILSFEKIDLLKEARQKDKPLVIAFFGINGTGKTTSIAKLAHYFLKNKLSVVLAACDTFRAAAIQQLEEHADKLGVKIIKHDYGADAAAVAFDAIKYAEKNKIKVVLLDTAGRLHSNTNLMQELDKIMRVAKPDLKIFVGESITGNDCIEQAKRFNDLVEMDGAILTKADVDEKGGAPLSISFTIKKPILFLGTGQRYEDLEEFDADNILKRLGF